MVTPALDMLETYPARLGRVDRVALARCIEECFASVEVCTACADACLCEDEVTELRKCIRTNLDCADVCDATGRVLSRHTGYDAHVTRALLEACATVCAACADECDLHTGHHHCQVCARACRRCATACRELLAAMP
ncbi:four-helix bundle copper-binding protein [Streptomyces sp. JJ66]|uniref:four-helix bundle copper-binding protein n=1 Tax=Streptomyces sp. JJ66 TaxID=2803843 RepID=UPI001C5869B1|nr:four-helix bundle copper-binding protein [Streptomyces sp. JJ66]MBW1604210.1 four-helix bundle copper-binding protein [Streptomyces sp. JJ66]